MITISKEEAKKFLIIYHRLHRDNPIRGEEALLKHIKKVGCIQYDPINVIAYNSHLVLQSKVENYRPAMLDRLLYEDYCLIDAWDKNLSIYHIDDDVYFQRYRDRIHRYYSKQREQVLHLIPDLAEKMRQDGPLSSLDVKDSPTVDWAWAPTKAVRAALDFMFSNGEIFVHHKNNTRKYYDLAEHHPRLQRTEDPFQDDLSYFKWHLTRRIGGVGLLPARVDTYAFIAVDGLKAGNRRSVIDNLEEEGAIKSVRIEGIDTPYYIRTEDIALLKTVNEYPDDRPKAAIIAALDNLIWDRDMIEELFGFKYRWEVYVPESKREYGYYVLPVLYGYDFIGRIVMKYNRKTKALELHQWYFEKGYTGRSFDVNVFREMFRDFKDFLGAERLLVMDGAKNRTFLKSAIRRVK